MVGNVTAFVSPADRNPLTGTQDDLHKLAYLGGGTRVATADGHRAARDIRVGDRIPTMDSGIQTVRYVAGRHLSAAELRADPRLAPIRIAAGALGNGLPEQDLLVSPAQCMMLRSAQAEFLCDSSEVLVSAQKLLGLPGVKKVAPEEGVEYIHFVFDRHELVFVEGAVSESLNPGDLAGLPAEPALPDGMRVPENAVGAVPQGSRRATPPARMIPDDAVQRMLVREITLAHCAGPALSQLAPARLAEVLRLPPREAAMTMH